ncbi:MAG: flagellar protein FliT [Gammaproteobacteria bacterium]
MDRLLELTRAMWADAQAGEWATVIEREAERRAVMEDYVSGGPADAASPSVVAAMREVLELDNQTMDLLEQCRSEVGRQIRELASRRKVRAAYAANSR